jgi:hypothetical protein
MTWVKQRTTMQAESYVRIDLCDFEPAQLLQGLIDAKWLTEEQAEAVRRQASQPGGIDSSPFIESELDMAADEMRCGRKSEALIHLERYLGREWIGRLA